MKYLILLKFWIKKTFNLPIYRKDVLQYVKITHKKYIYSVGLCKTIADALFWFNIYVDLYNNIKDYFPKFGDNINKFNGDNNFAYWWTPVTWNTGRLDYLNWLINEYKDDKTNLRKLL